MQVCLDMKRLPRPAYTLIEILIALTLLVALAAITVPSTIRLMGDRAVQAAGEAVRVQISNTRLLALETGLDYQFRFEPGGRRCVTVPVDLDTTGGIAATTTSQSGPVAIVRTPAGAAFKRPRRILGELPKGFRFSTGSGLGTAIVAGAATTNVGGQTVQAGEKLPEALFAGLTNSGELAAIAWSPAMSFRPVGTSLDAVLVVDDGRGRKMPVRVRGLTGTATAGPMESMAVKAGRTAKGAGQ